MQGRKRWGGVFLGDNERDRTIAAWLDNAANNPDINISDLVKEYLYTLATGGQPPPDPTIASLAAVLDQLRTLSRHVEDQGAEIAQLRRALANGVAVVLPAEPVDTEDIEGADEIRRRLASMPD